MNLPFVVKVCGVTNYADAQAALDAGANALGFNFYSKSPRFVRVAEAAEIMAKLRGSATGTKPCRQTAEESVATGVPVLREFRRSYLRVGVFVHPTVETIANVSELLDVAQIHGGGNAPIAVWRAIAAGTPPPSESNADAWLVDSFTPGFGGSGKTFDWSLAANFPYRAIIAGGLDAGNVAEAIRIAKPWGVDSCSRLESEPGKKDHKRVAAFVNAALESFQAEITSQALSI